MKAHYAFRCAEGHKWKALGREIVRNHAWCLLCANMDKIHAATPVQVKLKRLQGPLALRKGLRLNQKDFWSALGVTQSGGSRYERGQKISKPVATLLELVHVKKLDLKKIEAGDMVFISYLKAHEPDLYATLTKAVSKNRKSGKQR